jgi:hypothetical protein
LTGAKFGYYGEITPWKEYSNTRVEKIIEEMAGRNIDTLED